MHSAGLGTAPESAHVLCVDIGYCSTVFQTLYLGALMCLCRCWVWLHSALNIVSTLQLFFANDSLKIVWWFGPCIVL